MTEDHGHSHYEVGAASDVHDHHVGEIDGAVSQDHLATLIGQVTRLTESVHDLHAQLAAEREVTAAVKRGCVSLPGLVTVLRNRSAELLGVGAPSGAITDFDRALGRELRALADGIDQR
jgi:hypothetical protein